MLLRPLAVDDRNVLAEFTCGRLGEPWTEVVQRNVREGLSDEIAARRVSALGLFDEDGVLCGVAAWRIQGSPPDLVLCRADIVAVAVTKQRAGFGRQLKEAIIAEARSAGAVAVDSIVHRHNTAMINLNRKLGGVVDAMDEEPDHWLCVIPLS